jgi:8-oxo-dGTP diphosphatase
LQHVTHFNVAAGILCDAAGRVLISERIGGGVFDGMWEFPGGKIIAGETSLEALSRELAEELGIEVTVCAPFMDLRHEYDDRTVTIEFFLVSDWNSEPVGREGQELRWVLRENLDASELLPADVPVVEALQRSH